MQAMRLIVSVLAAALVSGTAAQQLPQLTQYQFNDYLFNPAVAGSRPWFELRSAHRYQWVGIQDAPRTFALSATTPMGRAGKMGLGGYIFTDHVGPTRRTGVRASYAYHLHITEETKLAFGLSAGLLQFLVDGSKISLHDPGDPAMDDQLRGDLVPDAEFGIYLYHPRYWFGASVPQIMRNKIYFFDSEHETLSRLEDHYYAMGGYRLLVGDDWKVEPSFLVKYVDPVPVKVDLTATVRYRDQFWVGASYRTNDAWCAMLGCWIKESFQFGYSYDIITSNLRNYSSGTHEVMLAVTFGRALQPAQGGTAPSR